jgi:two-component system cell cycle response regulator
MVEAKTRITSVKGIMESAPSGNECLVVIHGHDLGRKHELSETVVTLGREPDNLIVIDADSVSRNHARIETFNGFKYLVDLNSTNGTYLNDAVAMREQLTSGDLIKVGDTIFKYLAGSDIEQAYHEEIYTMTVTDGLTQTPNKRALMDFLDREFSRARRYGRNLGCIMFDIDHFKRINDDYGHLTGDYVLRELAHVVRRRIRKDEIFALYGGDEFCIVLPEAEPSGVLEFAETIRSIVANHVFEFESEHIKVTISLGLAHLQTSMEEPNDLIKAADVKLYESKNTGRNRVCA